jgi:hypothetical protein
MLTKLGPWEFQFCYRSDEQRIFVLLLMGFVMCKSICKSFSKSHSLNHHSESHLHKNHFLYHFVLKQFFYISCALYRVILVFYFWLTKNLSRRWLYLNNHLDKLLESIYEGLRESLGDALTMLDLSSHLLYNLDFFIKKLHNRASTITTIKIYAPHVCPLVI